MIAYDDRDLTMTTTLSRLENPHARAVPRTPGEDFVRIRFAGDSGDGMQLTGTQFAAAAAEFGNDFATFPDFPAEIRAPIGTTYGVSAYSINIGQTEIQTYGDAVDLLVAMNPAALKVSLADLRDGGTILLDSGTFTDRNLAKAGYQEDPRTDDSLARFKIIELDISKLTLTSVKPFELSLKAALRCKNMWTLGLVLWMFGRDISVVTTWLESRFRKDEQVRESNLTALKAGHVFGETAEMQTPVERFDIPAAPTNPGLYRTVTGSETLAWGLYAGARLRGLKIMLGSYPITPASPLLHSLSRFKDKGVVTFQAEDEIGAICAAIGASYAGALGITTSSGPGIALKTEAIGLAISTELPLVIINVQRGGPSTGLPTKTEQADLNQAVYGRNGDAPVPVIAAASPADCFERAIEAIEIATRFMTPVILLSDGYIANAAEPWEIPDLNDPAYAENPVQFQTESDGFHPYLRDPATGARPWAVPGTPGLEHRIGGLEKDFNSGNVSYDRDNHQRMTDARVGKIAGIADFLPEQTVEIGNDHGRLAVLTWGSPYSAARVAVRRARGDGHDISLIQLRHIWPLPRNLTALLSQFDHLLLPEMNTGQLASLLRAETGIEPVSLTKVTGQPFQVSEIQNRIRQLLEA
jgi:2-oxoglutarate ferredoxin oxidoreductase subunit alpha